MGVESLNQLTYSIRVGYVVIRKSLHLFLFTLIFVILGEHCYITFAFCCRKSVYRLSSEIGRESSWVKIHVPSLGPL